MKVSRPADVPVSHLGSPKRLYWRGMRFMFRKDDSQFNALVNGTLTALMQSGNINTLYTKWFLRPVPPANVNLNFPTSPAVQEAYKNPNNKGI